MQVQHINAKALTKTASLPQCIPTTLPQILESSSGANDNTAIMIGLILRCGVIASASITLLGLLLVLLLPGGLSAQRVLTFPDTPGQVWVGLLAFHPQAIIVLGLLLLIATPVFSVAASAVAFARERDRLYMTIALIVLGILITSLLLGKGMS